MTRAELATWLHEIDRAQHAAITQLTEDIAVTVDADQKRKLSQLRMKVIERNVEFHAVLFETDEGEFISLTQLIFTAPRPASP